MSIANGTVSSETYVLFTLADCTYGVASQELQHLEMVDTVTPVPNAAAYVSGITFSRGRVTPVIDLRKRFGLPSKTATLKTRLLVVGSGRRSVGLMVDDAKRFESIARDRIEPPPPAIAEGGFVKGIATVGDRTVLLIDVERIVAPMESTKPVDPAAQGQANSMSSARGGERHGSA